MTDFEIVTRVVELGSPGGPDAAPRTPKIKIKMKFKILQKPYKTQPVRQFKLGSIKIVITVHQCWAVFGQFFLGTGRLPGWSPSPPLASCHRDTNRARSGPISGQFWGPVLGPARPVGGSSRGPKPDIDCYYNPDRAKV